MYDILVLKERLIMKAKHIFIIIALGFIIYANSLTNEFIWDDTNLIAENNYLKSLKSPGGLFDKNITYGTGEPSNFYRPLQMLLYKVNYMLLGLDVRSFHFTNILIHILAALMVYKLAYFLSGKHMAGFISGLIFVSHPINTEAVTYIAGIADPLALLFILLALTTYIGKGFYAISIASFAAALLSKEIAIVTPLLLIAYDYTHNKGMKESLKRLWPFLAMGVAYIILRKTMLNFPTPEVDSIYKGAAAVLIVFKCLAMYFMKLILPLGLHMEYAIPAPALFDPYVMAGIAISVILVSALVFTRKTNGLLSFSIAYFLITYVPISNIYPLNAAFAEHWIYIPSAGLYILLAWAITKVYENKKALGRLLIVLLAIAVIANSYLTMKQNEIWGDAEKFYRGILKHSPGRPWIYTNLGTYYISKNEIDKSIEILKEGLEINPGHTGLYENLSNAYLSKEWYDQAIEVCDKGLTIDNNSPVLRNNLGVAYYRKGQYDNAITEYKKAISINPYKIGAYVNLGAIYGMRKQYDEAIDILKKALSIDPDNATACNNLGMVYYFTNQRDLARKYFERALGLGYPVNEKYLEDLRQ